MHVERLVRNAGMSVAQVLVAGGILFLLYRYLLHTIGSEKLGVWAVVLATASASRFGEMGLSGSAVKFTARYISGGEPERAAQVIQTTVVTIGIVLAFVLLAGYPLVVWLLGLIIPAIYSSAVISILPYALMSVWITAIAGVFLSGLDGCQRMDLRAVIAMLSGVTLLGFTWMLVPEFGLIGVAWAQIAQGALMLLASWILLRREMPSLPVFPYRWRFTLFREMLSYGVNFQIISLVGMLFEPMTKALMAKFGGLTLTAYYEMANKMVVQCRALLVSANQVIVPQVAALQESSPEQMRRIYEDTYRVVFFLALPLYAGIAAAAPLVSHLWIGHYEHAFVVYTLLLCVGFGFNTLVGPAYFVNLGAGSLRWNTLSQVAIGILNAFLGFLLGAAFGGEGVVAGYVLALVIGSSLMVIGHHRDNRIPFSILWPAESRRLLLACCLGLSAGWAFRHFLFLVMPERFLASASLTLAICVLVICPAFWSHPLRPILFRKVTAAFWKSATHN